MTARLNVEEWFTADCILCGWSLEETIPEWEMDEFHMKFDAHAATHEETRVVFIQNFPIYRVYCPECKWESDPYEDRIADALHHAEEHNVEAHAVANSYISIP